MTAPISVLLPLRSATPFLGEALASLQAQTFNEWRGVLCPVGAAATALTAPAAAADPRFRAGPAAATEAAALARAADAIDSEYLCVLDPDDALAPSALAELHAALAARPDAGMAYSRHVLVDAGGRMLGPGPLCELPYSPEALLLDWMTGPLRLLRTAAYRRAGGHTDAHPDAIDYDLCLRLSETCAVVHVPQPLYLRRIHADAPEVARWAEGIEARYAAFVAAVRRRGLDARYDTALQVDSWHILQPLPAQ